MLVSCAAIDILRLGRVDVLLESILPQRDLISSRAKSDAQHLVTNKEMAHQRTKTLDRQMTKANTIGNVNKT